MTTRLLTHNVTCLRSLSSLSGQGVGLTTYRRLTRARSSMPDLAHPNEDLYPHGLMSFSKEHNPGGLMEATLRRLGEVEVVPSPGESKFVHPQTVMYHLDVKNFATLMAEAEVGHGISAFKCGDHFVSQAAALVADGIIDKSKSLEDIAREEVEEECGFVVPVEAVRPVTMYVSSTGISGAKHHMFCVDVDDSMRTSCGGGLQDTGEAIEVLALPLDKAHAFMDDHSLFKSAGLLFGLLWLRTEKALAGAT
ncbi:probable uridine diphosphate glucose pyrophosphatase NUDT14 at C-terminar half [Coccomyxa sp. Obi]|nr:probable uridine diphosphate glucose pyrophosphatase NUDT14 at C-terminar half [Coccomyxa sp. Obi]